MTPSVPCQISRRSGFDVYGQHKYVPFKPAKCSVVKLGRGNDFSTVRADSSASRAHAREFIADAVLLFLPSVFMLVDDKIEIGGVLLRVASIQPRYAVNGRLDHHEVECVIWV